MTWERLDFAWWKPPVGAETGGDVVGDERLGVGELSGKEADANVPVLLVQKVDTSNIQNETSANWVSRAEGLTGCLSPFLGGTTAMGEELSSACGRARGPHSPRRVPCRAGRRARRSKRERTTACESRVLTGLGDLRAPRTAPDWAGNRERREREVF